MRNEEDLKLALLVLGASFTEGKVRKAIWGGVPEAEREAWGGYLALGWMTGSNNLFQNALEYCTVKLIDLAIKEEKERGEKNGQ